MIDKLKAAEDYNSLKKFISNYKGSFKDLCQELDGYHYEENIQFDCCWKSLTVTIELKSNETVINPMIEVWDKQNFNYEILNINKEG